MRQSAWRKFRVGRSRLPCGRIRSVRGGRDAPDCDRRGECRCDKGSILGRQVRKNPRDRYWPPNGVDEMFPCSLTRTGLYDEMHTPAPKDPYIFWMCRAL